MCLVDVLLVMMRVFEILWQNNKAQQAINQTSLLLLACCRATRTQDALRIPTSGWSFGIRA